MPTKRIDKHNAYLAAAARRLMPAHTMNNITSLFSKALIELGPTATNKQVKEALLSVVMQMEFNLRRLGESGIAKDVIQIEKDYPKGSRWKK